MSEPTVVAGSDYRYVVEVCDVADQDRLRTYRTKRSEWLHQLNGDSEHAVWKQISAMLWNDAVFRTINETRRLSIDGKRRSAALNGKLARFIDQGFVATQTLSIRKLMEAPAKNPARQVISLRRVLDDIKAHRELITREHYVAHDGLPFDPEPARRRHYDEILAKAPGGVWVGSLPSHGPDAFDIAELVHERFDNLSGVARSDRTRGDLIRPEIFSRLDTVLDESGWEDIKEFGNKFVAHAADEHSRSLLHEGQHGFSLDRLARCQKALCQVASAIYGSILWEGSRGLIPIPQFDQFEQLDAPWMAPEGMSQLGKFWDAHVNQVEQWNSTDILKPSSADNPRP